VRRLAIATALAVCLLGCGPTPVQLLTGGVPGYTEDGGCFLSSEIGELIVDPDYGTALKIGGRSPVPVMWQPGFKGARLGSEVAVLEPFGNIIATTGRTYLISGQLWHVEHDLAVLNDPNAGMGAGARRADRSRLDIDTVFVACGSISRPPPPD
jgi:hypothetical protein